MLKKELCNSPCWPLGVRYMFLNPGKSINNKVNQLTIKFKIKCNNKVKVNIKVKITIKFVVLTFQIIDQQPS